MREHQSKPTGGASRFTFDASRITHEALRATPQASLAAERRLDPEWLDSLPPADPRAVRSRRDLQRVNACMGNAGTMAWALCSACDGRMSRRLVELGAGDGRFLLSVARRLPAGWRGTIAALLDRLNVVSPATCLDFEALGWRAEILEAEALDWLTRQAVPARDVMVANLFLHHFTGAQLSRLLRAAARLARVFIAVEPRRSAPSLLVSRWLWFIGCNRVTRHDAPISVRAGFTSDDLSRLWPAGDDWTLQERPAGWFSHLFIAQRRE